MSIFEAVGDSPLSLAIVVPAVAVAVAREIAAASSSEWAAEFRRLLRTPFVVLLAAFTLVVAARVVLILD